MKMKFWVKGRDGYGGGGGGGGVCGEGGRVVSEPPEPLLNLSWLFFNCLQYRPEQIV